MQTKLLRVLAVLLAVTLFAACGSDDDDPAASDEGTDGSETTEAPEGEGAAGGDFIDLGTVVGDPLEHVDPALNSTLDGFQVVNAVYDGLTDIDSTDPENPEIVPHVAESFETNEDSTVWTFQIREGQAF